MRLQRALLCLLILQCSLERGPGQSLRQAPMEEAAKAYLDRALDYMEKYGPYRKQMNWKVLRREAAELAAGATRTEETYPAINMVCAQQKNHSCQLMNLPKPSAETQRKVYEIERRYRHWDGRKLLLARHPSVFTGRKVPIFAMLESSGHRYAYLYLPAAGAGDPTFDLDESPPRWANAIQELIEKARTRGAEGWIVDLRGSSGGFLPPMLAGLQPLLGDVTLLKIDGRHNRWSFVSERGAIFQKWGHHNSYLVLELPRSRSIDESGAPVAILLDGATGGASEGLAIAFKGRPNTVFAGSRSAGDNAMGTYFRLSDGAVLWILDGETSDRLGQRYPEGIEPDVTLSDQDSAVSLASDSVIVGAEMKLGQMLSPHPK